jgi:hypothetical protein
MLQTESKIKGRFKFLKLKMGFNQNQNFATKTEETEKNRGKTEELTESSFSVEGFVVKRTERVAMKRSENIAEIKIR